MRIFSFIQRKFSPSLTDMILLFSFIYGILFYSLITNYDLWWHIRTGDLLLSGIFPDKDLFSHTAKDFPWVLHEWGSQVVFAFIFEHFQSKGLIIFRALLISLCSWLLFSTLKSLKVSPFFSLMIAGISLFAFSKAYILRPHIFSLVFFLFTIRIYISGEKNSKMFYWLVPLLPIWLNLHGSWALGYVYLFLCGVSEAIPLISVKKRTVRRILFLKHLFIASLVSFLLCMANPYTFKAILYPFSYFIHKTHQVPIQHIFEWQPASTLNSLHFFISQIIIFALLILWPLKKPPFFLLPFLFLTLYTYRHHRMSIYYFAHLLPVLGLWLDGVTTYYKNEIKKISPRMSRFIFKEWGEGKQESLPMSASVLMAVCVVLLFSIDVNVYHPMGVAYDRYPISNIAFLKRHPLPGNIFNQYRWGGILIHEIRDRKVFIDGRVDVYGPAILEEYARVIDLEPGWKEVLTKYGVTHILVDKKEPVSYLLLEVDPSWMLVSEDARSKLFIRKSLLN